MEFTTGKVQQKKYRDQKRRMSIRKKKAGKTNKQTNKQTHCFVVVVRILKV